MESNKVESCFSLRNLTPYKTVKGLLVEMLYNAVSAEVCFISESSETEAKFYIFPVLFSKCLRKSSNEIKRTPCDTAIESQEPSGNICVLVNPIAIFVSQSCPVRLNPTAPKFCFPMQESVEVVWRDTR